VISRGTHQFGTPHDVDSGEEPLAAAEEIPTAALDDLDADLPPEQPADEPEKEE
jgi:hypothetical protein